MPILVFHGFSVKKRNGGFSQELIQVVVNHVAGIDHDWVYEIYTFKHFINSLWWSEFLESLITNVFEVFSWCFGYLWGHLSGLLWNLIQKLFHGLLPLSGNRIELLIIQKVLGYADEGDWSVLASVLTQIGNLLELGLRSDDLSVYVETGQEGILHILFPEQSAHLHFGNFWIVPGNDFFRQRYLVELDFLFLIFSLVASNFQKKIILNIFDGVFKVFLLES